jgi:hypothetical protein
MEKLHKFTQFLNEKKEVEKTGKKEIEKDAKKIISQIFDKTRNVQFEYTDGLPSYILFDVTEKDYSLEYDQALSMEYSEAVLKKRTFKVELKFQKKKEEKKSVKSSKYLMKFKIKLTKSANVKFEVEKDSYLVWEFENKPTAVISYIRKKQKCDWDAPFLKITKSSFSKLHSAEIRTMIKKAGGIKKKNEE